MATELDVLRIVSDRLGRQGIPFMLTGSYAMAYYTTPRMTRDLDLVMALEERDVEKFVAAFAEDFYVDIAAVCPSCWAAFPPGSSGARISFCQSWSGRGAPGRNCRCVTFVRCCDDTVDQQYLGFWAGDLGVSDLLERLKS